MSLGLMILEDGIGRALGNRVRSSSPRGPMLRKTISWFTTVLALGAVYVACRKPQASAPRPAEQGAGRQAVQAARERDLKGAPDEKPADQPAQIPTVGEVNASEAAGAQPTEPAAKDGKGQGVPGTAGEKGAPGTVGEKGTLAPTPAQAADTAKGPEAARVPVKTPSGPAPPVRVLSTADMNAGRVPTPRPAGQFNRGGKDQSASLAARGKVVTAPRLPAAGAAPAAKGPEAGSATAKRPADQPALALTPPTQGVSATQGPEAARATAGTPTGQAAPAPVPTPAEVDASKAAVVGSPEEVAKGAKDQGVPGAAGEKGAEAPTTSTPAADATKGAEAAQAINEKTAEKAIEKAVEKPADQAPTEDANAGKAPAVSPLETPTEQAARLAKGQGVPVTAGGRVVPLLPLPTQAANAARGPASRATSPADQAALARVATTDKDWSVRWTAVEGLTSQAVLARIATSDDDVDIRKLAVSMLTDQAALARIARNDKDWSVRWAAVNRLTVRAVLAQVAETDPDADIRKLAVSKLENRATP